MGKLSPLRHAHAFALGCLVGGSVLVAGCGKRDKPSPTRTTRAALAPDRMPALRAALKEDGLARCRELQAAIETLVKATEGSDAAAARTAYRDVRRRERDLSPTLRALAPMSSAGLGAYGTDKEDGAEGFRPLHAALAAEPPDFKRAHERAKTARVAAKSLCAEAGLLDWTSAQLGYALSDGAYVFGQRLDGSDAPDEATRVHDLQAEGGGLLRQIVAVRDAIRVDNPAIADELDADALVLSNFLKSLDGLDAQPDPVVRGTAAMVRATGHLGLHLRKAFAPTAEARIQPPYIAARGEEAVSAGTFPRPRYARDRAKEELGKQLFQSTTLSDNGHIACTSCHVEANAFSRTGARPLGGKGLPTAREPMSLLNVGHEVAFFWDGRAGSLEDQLDTVLDRDMSTTWPAVIERLTKDEALSASFARVTPGPPTVATTKAALVAFQRTLIADDLPLDRFFRGKDEALSTEASTGFDLFFGKARCSRCHRLPLTSGIVGPRFLETELSSIGVPKARGAKSRDPDEGRATVTKNKEDRAMFRVPTLREIKKTAPYFHNGSFATLEQVVDFYVDGAGLSVEKDIPNLDPEIQPFKLTADQKRALLAFLREGLSSP